MSDYLHPAIIIGLGGSGIEIVRRFRRRFHELYPDTPYVRFFGIDTAPQEVGTQEIPRLLDDEFFWSSRFDPNDYVGSSTIDSRREIKSWWQGYDGLPLQFVAAGAGQRRPVGRLAFFVHFQDIRELLRQSIQQIFDSKTYFDLPDEYKHSLNVYVVASTCGGTGTGMFLDVAHVTRQLAREIQPGKEVKVRGLMLLPSTFIGTGQVPPSVASALRANAFGALTELDYAMSLSVRERTSVTYPGSYSVRRDKPAFDTCYLLGNQSSSGAVFGKFDALLERAGIHMMIELASPLSARGDSRLDNMVSAIRATPDYQGRPRLYSSFAADWLELPSARVHARWSKMFAARLLARLRASGRGPGEERVKAAFSELWHRQSYGHLRRLMDRDGMNPYVPDVSAEEEALRDIPASGRTASELIQGAGVLAAGYKRLLANASAINSGIDESLRAISAELEQAVGELLGVGSLQDGRAFLDRVRSELDQWSMQSTSDRNKVDPGEWLTEFSTRINALTPSVIERMRSARPSFVRQQLEIVEDGINAAREAAVAVLRSRIAAQLLAADGLPVIRHRVELLIERAERTLAVAEGASVVISRSPEPVLPAGLGAFAVTDDRSDAAFHEPERLETLDQQAKAQLATLIEGKEQITAEMLAERLLRSAKKVVGDAAKAYLATLRIPAATVGDRINQLEPFALFTSRWSSTDGSRKIQRLDLIGLPDHMREQRDAVLAAIDPGRRSSAEIAEHADPDRLMMTGQVHGYPLFALAELAECKAAHDATPALEQSLRFTLPELEARRWDVMPMSSDDAARWFSLALSLKRVRRDLQRYGYIAGENGVSVPLGDARDDPSEARRNAREAFADSGYAAVLSRDVEVRVSRDGNAWLRNALKQWLDEQEPQVEQPDYPQEFRTDVERVRNYYRSIQFS